MEMDTIAKQIVKEYIGGTTALLSVDEETEIKEQEKELEPQIMLQYTTGGHSEYIMTAEGNEAYYNVVYDEDINEWKLNVYTKSDTQTITEEDLKNA